MSGLGDTPTLAEVIKLGVTGALAMVETILPGRITAYDHEQQRASVQPIIKGAYLNSDRVIAFEDLPEIHNCPVAFFAAGNASLTNKLKVGDRVTLLFASRDMAGWLTSDGDSSTPNDPRRHALDDVIVIAGLRSFKSPLPSSAVSDTDAVLAADAIQLGSSAASMFVVLDTLLTTYINNQIVSVFNAHTHNYIQPAMPGAAGPTLVPNSTMSTVADSDINSDKVRSE